IGSMDVPRIIAPGETATFDVIIDPNNDTLVGGSQTLFYRFDGGAFQSVPLSSTGGDNYEAMLPAPACGDAPEFYVAAESVETGMVTDPPNAPAEVFTADVGVLNIVFEDDAETDLGWSLGVPGDTATTGIWERVVPVGTAAQPGSDNSEDGTFCFVTGNAPPGAGIGDNDVDGGTTTLLSPEIVIPAGQDVRISYFRWFSNDASAAPNTEPFFVDISADNGPWVNVETIGPAGEGTSGGWIFHEFTVSDFVSPSSNVRVRFVTQDPDPGSLVEAAVDDFNVTYIECAVTKSCVGDLDGDGSVGASDLGALLGSWGLTDVPGDLDGGGVGASDLGTLLGSWGPCP
ncbi:MAG: hypothetical protein VYC34_08570, partial [Planctomycetota bacterium]|nr:hypothetical protein [Planctomycetota bacterium]